MAALPVAPNPVQRDLTQEELDKLDKQRRAVMRELRIFLRDITNKLIAERKFKDFVNPVNCDEVIFRNVVPFKCFVSMAIGT